MPLACASLRLAPGKCDSVRSALRRSAPRRVGAGAVGADELGLAQAGAGEIGFGQNRAGEIGLSQIGQAQIGPAQISANTAFTTEAEILVRIENFGQGAAGVADVFRFAQAFGPASGQ